MRENDSEHSNSENNRTKPASGDCETRQQTQRLGDAHLLQLTCNPGVIGENDDIGTVGRRTQRLANGSMIRDH